MPSAVFGRSVLIRVGVGSNLTLIDYANTMRVGEFDRVFGRDGMTPGVLVAVINEGRERC